MVINSCFTIYKSVKLPLNPLFIECCQLNLFKYVRITVQTFNFYVKNAGLILAFTFISLVADCLTEENTYVGRENVKDPFNPFNLMENIEPMASGIDPVIEAEKIINELFFGKYDKNTNMVNKLAYTNPTRDPMEHYPSGEIMRKDLYGNKSTVHIPSNEYMYPGHCRMKMTKDYMQTAANAFAIFTMGSVEDILNLPREYVLHSARTISMLKIFRDKLAATWIVVKGNLKPREVTHESLQLYRPLFKYINAREMAKLNLSDERIISFIGTHPELSRHQVAIVAKRYIRKNRLWSTPKYLSLMNNLLCGIPMVYMKHVDETVFLQMAAQVFYHIRSCDPLQRRFYLMKMTKTAVLGKAYSWSARDVSRLGLLLAEVKGIDLSTINPQAMTAISAQVMREISADNLRQITDVQLRYINPKSMNILSKKMKKYKEHRMSLNKAFVNTQISTIIIWIHSLWSFLSIHGCTLQTFIVNK